MIKAKVLKNKYFVRLCDGFRGLLIPLPTALLSVDIALNWLCTGSFCRISELKVPCLAYYLHACHSPQLISKCPDSKLASPKLSAQGPPPTLLYPHLPQSCPAAVHLTLCTSSNLTASDC